MKYLIYSIHVGEYWKPVYSNFDNTLNKKKSTHIYYLEFLVIEKARFVIKNT